MVKRFPTETDKGSGEVFKKIGRGVREFLTGDAGGFLRGSGITQNISRATSAAVRRGARSSANAEVAGTKAKGGDRFKPGGGAIAQPVPEQTKKITRPSTPSTPRLRGERALAAQKGKGVTSGSITTPSAAFRGSREELGDFYLNATAGLLGLDDLPRPRKKR